jgi:SH3-like domain-containing protein
MPIKIDGLVIEKIPRPGKPILVAMPASRPARFTSRPRAPRPAALPAALLVLLMAVPSALAADKGEDGANLPRFATTRYAPTNVRVGPGLKYDIAWVFNRAHTPVEIIAEFDIWREIRDFDGTEGWIEQNLLSDSRAGLVEPWKKDGQVALLAGQSDDAPPRAYLPTGFRVDITHCNGAWCQVQATGTDTAGHTGTYAGYLPQSEIWGVYQDEKF